MNPLQPLAGMAFIEQAIADRLPTLNAEPTQIEVTYIETHDESVPFVWSEDHITLEWKPF